MLCACWDMILFDDELVDMTLFCCDDRCGVEMREIYIIIKGIKSIYMYYYVLYCNVPYSKEFELYSKCLMMNQLKNIIKSFVIVLLFFISYDLLPTLLKSVLDMTFVMMDDQIPLWSDIIKKLSWFIDKIELTSFNNTNLIL